MASEFCILGSGAMGLVFATSIARARIPVKLLLRPSALKLFDGSITEEQRPPPPAPFMRETFRVEAEQASKHGTSISTLILATKAQHALEALTSIEGRLNSDSVVVLAQNGVLGVMDQLKSYFPASKLPRFVYGVLNHGGNRPPNEPFTVEHSVPHGYALFGTERSIDILREKEVVAALSNIPGLNVKWIDTPEEVRAIVYKKLLLNCGVNALSGIGRSCNNGKIAESPYAVNIVKATIEECLKVVGENLPNETVESLMESYMGQMSRNAPTRTSMCEDLDARRKTEIQFFNGFISKLGRGMGIPTPVNDLLTNSIHFLEELVESQ
ncbi:2-dehydropantoate 2-reductase [Synchytrium microbalum]|uniref:2-dehydropantoate 2-reductase n=1 Tax=Synchytrium microbalum TaxID=1806994 RepID=A0A507CJ37_9FUNG|nr:2-dehydropantoate 2-reductase [Synchytrium microbalum]TPX37723.1 2-dehydropantoate 2-reductase [Synchytrium microbalum]